MNIHELSCFPIHSLQFIFSPLYNSSAISKKRRAHVFAARILFLSLSLDFKTSFNVLKYPLPKRSFILLSITRSTGCPRKFVPCLPENYDKAENVLTSPYYMMLLSRFSMKVCYHPRKNPSRNDGAMMLRRPNLPDERNQRSAILCYFFATIKSSMDELTQ